MRRRITTILLVILLISGVGVLAYPWVSHYVNAVSQTYVIEDYREHVSEMGPQEIQKEKLKAAQYDQTVVSSEVEDPFATEQVTQAGSYANILNVGETMGYLKIPKIDVELPIYHGTNEVAMQEGVGHMEGTSMPVGGSGTHCVLASHSGLPEAKLFTDLEKLEIGDHFLIYVLDETLTYEVDQINIVLPSDTSKIQVVPNEDYVTLLTCTPIGANTHRLLVRGRRIPNEVPKNDAALSGNAVADSTIVPIIWWMMPLVAAGCVLFFFGVKKFRHILK